MSKLFDRQDHEWELAQIDAAEQEAQRSLSGFQLALLDGKSSTLKNKEGKRVTTYRSNVFDRLRLRSRMKLLRTSTLMADLKAAFALRRACPHCLEVPKKEGGTTWRYCNVHAPIVRKAIMAVKYAGEENLETRLAQGRVWGEDELSAHEDHTNEWERWYLDDRREGVWPGTKAYTGTQADLQKLKEEYGDLGYLGWLNMLADNEEISHSDLVAEKARFSNASVSS